ncbi:arginine--tRNA ligase [bacterium]|nr:arginine--tRNA ligase [bacterium]MBU1025066.1 arginine--tRNA ligase [bacterium]
MKIELREIITAVLEEKGYPVPEIQFRSIPFKGSWGIACSFLFQLLNQLKDTHEDFDRDKVSEEILHAIREKTKSIESLEKIEFEKGFINFHFVPKAAVKRTITDILTQGNLYGKGPDRDEKVMVEYSQPNTHKDMHIGHLRNVCLGISLVNILRFAGFETVAANYLGDIGTHVIKCLWGYKRFYKGMEPPSGRGRWLGEIYSFAENKYQTSEKMREGATEWLRKFFSQPSNTAEETISQATLEYMRREQILLLPELDKKTLSENMAKTLTFIRNKMKDLLHNGMVSIKAVQSIKENIGHFDENNSIWSYADEVLDLYKDWENNEPELVELWKQTRDWSLTHFDSIYSELGAHFDVVFYESEVESSGKEIVQELIQSGIAQMDEGATIVKIDEKLGLEKETYRNFMVLKSDGSSLYSTKDLALAKLKFEKYEIDRSIYLVDVGQSFYFQQLFKVLELMGFKQAKKCYHLSYGQVQLPEGKMSSRLGNVVHYTDLRNELYVRAKKIVRMKKPGAGEDVWRGIARLVAYGAMKYNMVKIDSDKNMVFDWDEALDFEGRTAPYIQYAHARACNILEKAGKLEHLLICSSEINEPELELAKKLSEFPMIIDKCAAEAKPLPLATYVYELAQTFSDFYHRCPVTQESDEGSKATRIALVLCTKSVLGKGLALMGIDAPSSM